MNQVKYLPQSYLETLCNELGDGGSETFDAELRKIIYSHVPVEDQLGQPSMDALLNFKVAEINKAMDALRARISAVNTKIVGAETRLFPEFKKSLDERLVAKRTELASLEESKPREVEDPNASPEVLEESKQAVTEIDGLEQQLRLVGEEEVGLREAKSIAAKKQAVAGRIAQALINQKKQTPALPEHRREDWEKLQAAPPDFSSLYIYTPMSYTGNIHAEPARARTQALLPQTVPLRLAPWHSQSVRWHCFSRCSIRI